MSTHTCSNHAMVPTKVGVLQPAAICAHFRQSPLIFKFASNFFFYSCTKQNEPTSVQPSPRYSNSQVSSMPKLFLLFRSLLHACSINPVAALSVFRNIF